MTSSSNFKKLWKTKMEENRGLKQEICGLKNERDQYKFENMELKARLMRFTQSNNENHREGAIITMPITQENDDDINGGYQYVRNEVSVLVVSDADNHDEDSDDEEQGNTTSTAGNISHITDGGTLIDKQNDTDDGIEIVTIDDKPNGKNEAVITDFQSKDNDSGADDINDADNEILTDGGCDIDASEDATKIEQELAGATNKRSLCCKVFIKSSTDLFFKIKDLEDALSEVITFALSSMIISCWVYLYQGLLFILNVISPHSCSYIDEIVRGLMFGLILLINAGIMIYFMSKKAIKWTQMALHLIILIFRLLLISSLPFSCFTGDANLFEECVFLIGLIVVIVYFLGIRKNGYAVLFIFIFIIYFIGICIVYFVIK